MGFLKVILFLGLFYYLLKFLGRLFAPQLVSYATKKAEAHFEKHYGFDPQTASKTSEDGEIILNKKKDSKSKTHHKVGEYIDFEEIE